MIHLIDLKETQREAREIFAGKAKAIREATRKRLKTYDNLESIEMSQKEYEFAKAEREYCLLVDDFITTSALYFKQWQFYFDDIQESAEVIADGADQRERLDFILEYSKGLEKQNQLLLEIVGVKMS